MPRGQDQRVAEEKRRAFVDAFLGPAKLNASEAAKAAGYKGKPAALAVSATRLLAHPQVQDLLRLRAQAAGIDSQKVLQLLWSHLHGSMADFVTLDGEVLLDLERARADGKLGLLRKFKQKTRSWFEKDKDDELVEKTETTIEIELYSAQTAADKLAKCLGLYNDQDDKGAGVQIDEDRLIDRLLLWNIPRSKWLPGLVRRYEARERKPVSSREVPK